MDDKYEILSLNELKQYCRVNGLKGFSKHTKKESIRDFIRSKNIVVEDKEDIIRELQEQLKEQSDKVKELELKECFEDPEDPEVDTIDELSDNKLSDNELSDNEYQDVSSEEFHFDKKYDSKLEEKMRKDIEEKMRKDIEEKMRKDIEEKMRKDIEEKLLRLNTDRWHKIIHNRKEDLDEAMYWLKGRGKDIKLIDTCVNKYMIERYDHFLDKSGNKDKQIILFHGTCGKNIKPIMENGFSLTMNKEHGAVHGEGIYFTGDIDLATIYPKDNNMIKNIIVCQVYVNNKIEGKKAKNSFPKMPGSDKYYDTGVDNLRNPRQFIKKTCDEINILGHIQINIGNKKNNSRTGIHLINKTNKQLRVFCIPSQDKKLKFTDINISQCKTMGDLSPEMTRPIASCIGDQFIVGYYDKDKYFNIYRIINVNKFKEKFIID
jgi:hypothetical protein